jgi:hypothetical protein
VKLHKTTKKCFKDSHEQETLQHMKKDLNQLEEKLHIMKFTFIQSDESIVHQRKKNPIRVTIYTSKWNIYVSIFTHQFTTYSNSMTQNIPNQEHMI